MTEAEAREQIIAELQAEFEKTCCERAGAEDLPANPRYIPGRVIGEAEALRRYPPEWISWMREQLRPGEPLKVYQTPYIVWEFPATDACRKEGSK